MNCIYRLLFAAFLFSGLAFSIVDESAADYNDICGNFTSAAWNLKYKPQIYSTNNLRKRVGAFEVADGQEITIKGRVLDSKCRGIKGVVVQIWHADSKGTVRYNVPRVNYVNDKSLYSDRDTFTFASSEDIMNSDVKIDPAFVGSGSITTNNQGYYEFLTIMPGATPDLPPHVNFNVQSIKVKQFQTTMFFPAGKKFKNFSGIKDLKLSDNEIATLISEKISENEYRFDIVLKDEHPYLND